MGKYNVGSPMERIAVDVLGPLPLTESGNKYIVVIADYFTKWVEAVPIPDQEASTIAELLVKEVICRLGVPQLIHSDQGRNFESTLQRCASCSISKRREPHLTIQLLMEWLKDLTGHSRPNFPSLQSTTRETGTCTSLFS